MTVIAFVSVFSTLIDMGLVKSAKNSYTKTYCDGNYDMEVERTYVYIG